MTISLMFRFAKMILFETFEAIKKFEVSRISAFATKRSILIVMKYPSTPLLLARTTMIVMYRDWEINVAIYLPKCPYNSLAEAIWANPAKTRISE